ncbi:MAG: peptidoglycan DD-metalloendopeptidase family protein [Chloroflexota bacterium]
MTRVKYTFIALLLCGLFVSVRGAFAEKSIAPGQAVTPFLYPPYPGRASQESIFDHSTPNYTYDNRVLAFNGKEANKNCPSPAPPGVPPPVAGVCSAGDGIYWSYSLADWVAYDGHDGVDYGISYRPIYAAADADQVVYAGWWDPQNHKINLGMYVRLHHSNGYNTYYGHMSSVAVQACSNPGCTFIPHGTMLGISGNTGLSTGPHLHFLVRNPSGRSVDPYGWTGTGADPLIHNQKESLWIAYPALTFYGAQVYPSGEQLAYPAAPATGIIVDDNSVNFTESPASCWSITSAGSAQGNSFRYSKPRTSPANCTAHWSLPAGSASGVYSLYVRIPAVRATTEGAIYSINHEGRTDRVVVNQDVFPNAFYVTDGWVYIGRYNFTGEGGEYVELTNRTQDESASIADLFVGADAVRFVFQGNTTPTPPGPVSSTPTVTATLTRTATISPTPTNTFTPSSTTSPTLSRTPTASATPSRTRTPTITRTPTVTATGTLSKTPTPTRTSTRTARPTNTPQYTKVKLFFVNRIRYNANTPPIEVAGTRYVKSDNLYKNTLDEFFKGPGATERYSFGWIAVYNGFTGYSSLEVRDGIAQVHLTGICTSEGKTFNIADLITLNLKQFPAVQFVKIYDENGLTQTPTGNSDSEPRCLSEFKTPTPTPTRTATPTRTPTHTATSTHTRRPTITPMYVQVKVYFVSRARYNANTPPFEVNGVRWARTNNVLPTVLDEYFKGPGATERTSFGWAALYNGFTGYSRFELIDNTAHVYLKGTCTSDGRDFTIANLLILNLKQFPEVRFVKIYDENGSTQNPIGLADSIPACLLP